MVRHMYSNIFRSVFPKAHILLHRPVNTFTTKSNLPASLFNLNPPRSNTTPYYTTLQPRTPHSPPLSQHRHPFSTSSPTIISAAPPKNPSRSPHFVSQQGAKSCQRLNWAFVGDLQLGPPDVFALKSWNGLMQRALES